MPIREATVEDARAIAEVHVEGWAWGYRGLLPDRVIEALDVDARERQWIEGFTERWRDGDGCLLWEERGRALGFVAFGPAADEHAPPPPDAGEVYSIYLRREGVGAGIGRGTAGADGLAARSRGRNSGTPTVRNRCHSPSLRVSCVSSTVTALPRSTPARASSPKAPADRASSPFHP